MWTVEIDVSKTNIIGKWEMVSIRTIKETFPLRKRETWLLFSTTTPENLGCGKEENLKLCVKNKDAVCREIHATKMKYRHDTIPDTAYGEMVGKD